MGCCFGGMSIFGGNKPLKVSAYAWSTSIEKPHCMPFKSDSSQLEQPPPCKLPDGGGKAGEKILPAYELAPRWPAVEVHKGELPWEKSTATWLNRRWVQVLKGMSAHVVGREYILYAGLFEGGQSAVLLLSTGWLLVLQNKVKAPETWCQARHLLEMKAVKVTEAAGEFTISVQGGKKLPNSPPQTYAADEFLGEGIDRSGEAAVAFTLPKESAEGLIGAITSLVQASRLPIPALELPEGFAPKGLALPTPQCDGGFATIFRATLMYIGVKASEQVIGLKFLDALPFLELDISQFEPLSAVGDQAVAYSVTMALTACTNLKGFACRSKPISPQAWPHLYAGFLAGNILKVEFSDCKLSSAMVQQLGEAMEKASIVTVMDLDLSGAEIVSLEAVNSLAKGLEKVKAGMRRLILERCSLSSASRSLLQVIAGHGKTLEHLSLAGTAIGTLPAPHPLAGLLRGGKMKTLNLSGTNLDMSMVLSSGETNAPPSFRLGAMQVVNFKDTECSPGSQMLSEPVELFFKSLGKNLEQIEVGNFMKSTQAICQFIKALRSVPSKKFALNFSGLQGPLVMEALGKEVQEGPLPGNALEFDTANVSMTSTDPAALISVFNELELKVSKQFAEIAAAKPPPGQKGVVVAQPVVKPAEIQKNIANTCLQTLRTLAKSETLEKTGAVLASESAKMSKLSIVPPDPIPGKTMQLNHHMWASGALVKAALQRPTMGAGPQVASLVAALASSKDCISLDLTGACGGDALALVLGALVLRSNRSIRSLRVNGNLFSMNGWAAIRGAFYGNMKVVDFPFPADEVQQILACYSQRIQQLESGVMQSRSEIKRAFKSTKGRRTPFVVQTLNSNVEKIKGFKQEEARLKVTMRKYGKLQQEIQEAVQRNQQDEKNRAKQAKEQAKLQEGNWKEADKALEKATQLEQQKADSLAQQKASLWRDRTALMEMWTAKVQTLRQKKKDVTWFEEWARASAKASEPGAQARPVFTYDSAELMLSMVPAAMENECKKELKATEDLIDKELAVVAEQEMLQSQLDEQRAVAAKVLTSAGAPPSAAPAQYTHVQKLSNNAPVVQATVVMPPQTVAGQPVNQKNKKMQATQYDQLQMYQAQQAQKQQQFQQKPAAAAHQSSFASAYMYSHNQAYTAGAGKQKPWFAKPGGNGFGGHNAMMYGAGGAVVGGAVVGTAGWYMLQKQQEDEWRWRQMMMYNSGYGYGYHHHHHHYGHDQDQHHYHPPPQEDPTHDDALNPDDVVIDEPPPALDVGEPPEGDAGEPPEAEEVQEAEEAVEAYAGGKEDRIGGGPPPSGSTAAKEQPIFLNPTPPKLDVLEWFETQIRNIERSALEANLGRLGPMPCPSEVLLKLGSDAPAGVCLVTQCSLDRLPRLEVQLASWEGEVAVAVYVDAPPQGLRAAEARRDIAAACSRAAAERSKAGTLSSIAWTVMVVYRLPDEEVRCESYDRLYPVNTLRNMALSAARSDLVFLVDVDFVPSSGLYASICRSETDVCNLRRTLAGESSEGPIAVVVPAFEVKQKHVPATFDDLQDAVNGGSASGFHVSHFPRGHGSTDFRRWFAWQGHDAAAGGARSSADLMAEVHGVDAYSVPYAEHFEPYVIACRKHVPTYDERFRGYGLNKISHLYDMAEQGFRFCVLAHHEAFAVAEQHPRSESWLKMYGPDADAAHRARLSVHFASFKKEVATRAGRLRLAVKGEASLTHASSDGSPPEQCARLPISKVSDGIAGLVDQRNEDALAWLAALVLHLDYVLGQLRQPSPHITKEHRVVAAAAHAVV